MNRSKSYVMAPTASLGYVHQLVVTTYIRVLCLSLGRVTLFYLTNSGRARKTCSMATLKPKHSIGYCRDDDLGNLNVGHQHSITYYEHNHSMAIHHGTPHASSQHHQPSLNSSLPSRAVMGSSDECRNNVRGKKFYIQQLDPAKQFTRRRKMWNTP